MQRSAWTAAAIAVAMLATVAEFAVVTVGVLKVAPMSVLLAAHVGVCLLLGPGFMSLSPRSRGNPGFLLFTICTLAMGPLGALGTGLTAVLRRSFALRATPFEE